MNTQEVSVEDSIKQAMIEIGDKENVEDKHDIPEDVVETTVSRDRDESGKFTKKADKQDSPEKADEEPEVQKTEHKVKDDVPQSVPAALREKYAAAPPELRDWIAKRELDQHQMMTRHDGELRLGRELKEVITPYMPIIQAEGGSPAAAVQSLLNTAYQLRTASPAQKTALIGQICQQYGVDLSQINQQQTQIDPALKQVMDRLNGIEQKFTQQSTLQEQQEQVRITSEIQAFAADPKNIYFEQVKAAMAPLLGSSQAKDLQEAYDMACWANPQIRPVLMAAQEKEQAEKRKAEMAKKKQAAVSVTGSPGVKSPNSGTPQTKTAEESVREAMDELIGSKF